MLHKPYGYISQFKYNNVGNKRLLGELGDFPEGTMAIGRLDEKSEGLIFLTTDGKMSELVRSKKVEKEYYALVDGIPTEQQLKKMRDGLRIPMKGDFYQTRECAAKAIEIPSDFHPMKQRIRGDHHGPASWISITVVEGKFRQVRKMTAVVGLPTLRLVRVRIGQLKLGNLEAGKFVEIKDFDNL